MDYSIGVGLDMLGLFGNITILADCLVSYNPMVRSSRRGTASPGVTFEVFSAILSSYMCICHILVPLQSSLNPSCFLLLVPFALPLIGKLINMLMLGMLFLILLAHRDLLFKIVG
jgi:hypothetical protein